MLTIYKAIERSIFVIYLDDTGQKSKHLSLLSMDLFTRSLLIFFSQERMADIDLYGPQ